MSREQTQLLDDQERWYADNIVLRDQVIADVGAQTGRLSQFFREASEGTSRVVSIEPLAENVAAIRERIRAEGGEGWTVVACAASARKGTVGLSMHRNPQGGWNSTVTAAKAMRTAPCRPLSQIVPDATVVKLDIEGHEYGVLEEAVPRLERVHTWAVELHMVSGHPLQRVLGLLMGHGFRVFASARASRNASGPWISEEIPASLDWADIPVTRTRSDGSPFKMLHILAQRPPS